MRMTVTLDEKLLKEVMQAFGTKTKREAIEKGLQEALRSLRRKKALDHCGRLELDIDQTRLENLRSTS